MIFGRGRFNAGVIVDPRPEFKFDPEDAQKLAEFRNLIWYAFVFVIHLYRPNNILQAVHPEAQ